MSIDLHQCLESEDYYHAPRATEATGPAPPLEDQSTSIELTGTDRPGLLSEVCAVLASQSCNIVKAEVWTHDKRAAAVIQITDEATGLAVRDAGRLSKVRELLGNVMQGDGLAKKQGGNTNNTGVSVGGAHAERRLHKLMLDDGDEAEFGKAARPVAGGKVAVMDCAERRYTVVILRCRDRPKLLFDTLCALADLQYVVFHGTVDAEGASKEAYQVSMRSTIMAESNGHEHFHRQLIIISWRCCIAGVLHPARGRAPGALRRRADPARPLPRGRRREARIPCTLFGKY